MMMVIDIKDNNYTHRKKITYRVFIINLAWIYAVT